MNSTTSSLKSVALLLEQALKLVGEAAARETLQPTCLNCTYYNMQKCRLANAAPPKEVIAVGCEAYIFDPNSPPF